MEEPLGQITHYFSRLGVAVLQLSAEIKVGDRILILGHTTELEQNVTSLEINHQKIESALAGQEVALMVNEPVRSGDLVYLVSER